MPLLGFEPTLLVGERPQTYALDRATTGTGICFPLDVIFKPEVEPVDEKLRRYKSSWLQLTTRMNKNKIP
jgi:hypothetical protein